MNEDTLRDAFTARAAVVAFDPTAYERVLQRRSARRARRWAVAASATAALLVVATAGVAANRRSAPDPATPPPDGAVAPRWAIGVLGTSYVGQLDATTFAPRGTSVRADRPFEATSVAAARDGARAVVAWTHPERCETQLTGYTFSENKVVADDPAGDVSGSVTDVALSRDGRLLGYALRPSLPGATACADKVELHVRDLRTGTARTWQIGGRRTASTLSWDGDERRLALTIGNDDGTATVTVFDPFGGTQPMQAFVPAYPDLRPTCTESAPAFRGRTGDLAVVVTCSDDPTASVVAVDPETRRERRVLFDVPPLDGAVPRLDRLTFDASGEHAVAEAGDAVLRWDAGGTARWLPAGTPRHVTW